MYLNATTTVSRCLLDWDSDPGDPRPWRCRPSRRDLNVTGTYEDLNGNGVIDFNDVVLFFNQMDWIAENEPLAAFDFNHNGQIDFNDIVLLFNGVVGTDIELLPFPFFRPRPGSRTWRQARPGRPA